MSVYPAHLGETDHVFKDGRRRTWRPHGAVSFHVDPATGYASERQRNPIEAIGTGDNLAARFFVGLNVGQTTRWTPKDVADVVWAVRKEQGQNGSTTILSQLGIYESHGQKVEEPSVQVIVLDLTNTPEKKFVDEMAEVGETLARRLEQQEVILEIQKRGIVQRIYTVTP